ncbi:MAG: SMP-30/gluconolactonase/LRE family protein [Acidimicrobiales bacterium]
MTLTRVGDFTLTWGESLRWDDRRQRLYFVDCATQTLHWLDDAEPPLRSMKLPTMPAGLVLTDAGQLVACLDDGLHVVDPDAGTSELLAAYPEGMHGRANDANADGAGNLVTGTLNLVAAPGSSWWFSAAVGWKLLDDHIGNANGPVVIEINGQPTLVFGDTPARAVYAYPYDGAEGTVGVRRVFGDHAALGGAPDGATADADGGLWSCVLGVGKVARFTSAGLDRVVDTPMANPSDVTFGGPSLDRMFVTSIALNLGEEHPPATEAGWLFAADGLGVTGRPEARFRLG